MGGCEPDQSVIPECDFGLSWDDRASQCRCVSDPDSCTAYDLSLICNSAGDGCEQRTSPHCDPGLSWDESASQCRCDSDPDLCTAHDPSLVCNSAGDGCEPRTSPPCDPGLSWDDDAGQCRCHARPDSCSAYDPTVVCNAEGNGCDQRTHRVALYSVFGALFVQVTLDGVDTVLRYDSGSSTSYIDPMWASELEMESGPMQAQVGDLSMGERDFGIHEYLGADLPWPSLPGGSVHGSIGNDFFAGFAVGLDLKSMELWLIKAPDPDVPMPHPEGVGQCLASPIEQPLGFVVVPCRFGNEQQDRQCVYDVGAPDTIVFESVWSELAHPSEHTIPFLTTDYAGVPLQGYYQRAELVAVGDTSVPGTHVTVYETFDAIRELARQVDRVLAGAVGNNITREHFTIIDYPNDRVHFCPFVDRAHIPDDEFVGFGFVLGDYVDTDLRVDAVVPGSSAERAGVMASDLFFEIDGEPWWEDPDLEFAQGFWGLIAGDDGEARTFGFRRGSETHRFEVTAEDLLPAVP